MKSALLLLITTLTGNAIAALAASGPSTPTDQVAINEIMQRQQEAWNAGDSHAWAADYSEDADFVNILGFVFHGRLEIDQRHAGIFAGPYKGSHLVVSIRSLKMLAPAVALVEANLDLTGYRSLPGGMPPTSDGLLRTHMKYILVDTDHHWSIIAAQNTAEHPK